MKKEFSNHLRQYLINEESIIWVGKPKEGILFRSADIILIPFSLLWCGFAIVWTLDAVKSDVFSGVLGLLFVFIGLVLVFGRFIIDLKKRSNTIYVLTQNRVIIQSGIFSKKINFIPLKTMTKIDIVASNNGYGTIYLAPKSPYMEWTNSTGWWPGIEEIPQLELIPNARNVYKLILDLRNKG